MLKSEYTERLQQYLNGLNSWLYKTRPCYEKDQKYARLNPAQVEDWKKTMGSINKVISEVYRIEQELIRIKASPEKMEMWTVGYNKLAS